MKPIAIFLVALIGLAAAAPAVSSTAGSAGGDDERGPSQGNSPQKAGSQKPDRFDLTDMKQSLDDLNSAGDWAGKATGYDAYPATLSDDEDAFGPAPKKPQGTKRKGGQNKESADESESVEPKRKKADTRPKAQPKSGKNKDKQEAGAY